MNWKIKINKWKRVNYYFKINLAKLNINIWLLERIHIFCSCISDFEILVIYYSLLFFWRFLFFFILRLVENIFAVDIDLTNVVISILIVWILAVRINSFYKYIFIIIFSFFIFDFILFIFQLFIFKFSFSFTLNLRSRPFII